MDFSLFQNLYILKLWIILAKVILSILLDCMNHILFNKENSFIINTPREILMNKNSNLKKFYISIFCKSIKNTKHNLMVHDKKWSHDMIKVSQNFSDSSLQRMTLVQMFRNFTFVITLASGASYSRMMTADIMRCDSCPDSIHVYPFVKFRACVSPKL